MIWKSKLEINNAEDSGIDNNDFKLIEIREDTKTGMIEIEMCLNNDNSRIEIELNEFKRLIKIWNV